MVASKKETRNQLWLIHWVMAVIYAVIFSVGLYMVNLPDGDPSAGAFFSFHKSMGVLVMFLLTVRILWVIRSLPPGRPRNWLQVAALHTALYTFMVIVPLSGYFLSNPAGRGVSLFGLPLPILFGENKPFRETAELIHTWLAFTFAGFVGLHLVVHAKTISANWKRLTTRRAVL